MDLIKEIVRKSGIDVELKIIDRFERNPTNGGTYKVNEHKVTISIEGLRHVFDETSKETKDLQVDDVTQSVVGHELGHASDTNLKNSEKCLEKIDREIGKSIVNGNENVIKNLYRQRMALITEQEYFAWKVAPHFFTKPVCLETLKVIEEYSLNSYYRGFRRKYKHLLLAKKLFQKLYDVYWFFPNGISFNVKEDIEEKSTYHEEENMYIINVNHIRKNRHREYRNKLSTIDYMCYQTLYEFSLQEHKNLEQTYTKISGEIASYALKAQNYKKMIELIHHYERKVIQVEESILNEIGEAFEANSTYEVFKKVKMKLKKKELSEAKEKWTEYFIESKLKIETIS